jgi:hypothetical protein
MALNTEPSSEGALTRAARPFPLVALGTPAACSGGSAPGAYAGAARPR